MERTVIGCYVIEDDGEHVEIVNERTRNGVKLSAGDLFSFLGKHRGMVAVRGGPPLPSGVVVSVPLAWLREAVLILGDQGAVDLAANLLTLLPLTEEG